MEPDPTILVTISEGTLRESFFPPELRERLEGIGEIEWASEELTEVDLRERVEGVDVCVTGWGSPQVTSEVVERADSLELIAHTGGSVATIASPAAYDAGIRVVSANDPMAEFVAEHVLGTMLAARRRLPEFDRAMKEGKGTDSIPVESLIGAEIGLVGLGSIGRHLLAHLRSFDVSVTIYDPYLAEGTLAEYGFAERTDLETVLSGSDVVSIHASRTPETVEMLDSERLATLDDDTLLVNTARAELVVEEALLAELRSGRISAALDVFHEEPLPVDHELRGMDNVLLTPHVGGSRIRPPLTEAVLDDAENYLAGDPLAHEIPREQWELMTR
ncbi:hydroxyacid dehydrogenase [Saliphagus infecundisoli]|uniref:Hydroxyacid dehydrogenase n=1 Tax=Saliphagus infecundisoli TaxID=1849069 RepID=A0ABD5QD06_9EURY|nr:hydroxyacid dehydrogenase [Saliphagus infecundisoli]